MYNFYSLKAYDALNNINIQKCANWLLFGNNGIIDIEEKFIDSKFHETILIITKTKLLVFSSYPTRDYLYQIFSSVDELEVQYFFPTKQDEDNSVIIKN